MGIESAIGGAIGLGSALIGSSASKKAAKTQANAANQAALLQQQQFERQIELQKPFREAGERALPKLEAASEYTPFGQAQFQADPGYAFRLAEGEKALNRQAAARGGLISGGALRAATRYGQEMGSQEYTNAFNRYQTERQARLNPLQSLTGMGQTSVNQLGQAGQQYATNAGEALTSGAAARASGYVGQANALTGALGTGFNFYQNQQYMNKFAPQNAPSTGGGGSYGSGGGSYGGYTPPDYSFSEAKFGNQ
jgi:hypothetical protein